MSCETEGFDLAVVGMAASFANAKGLPDYWHGVVNGTPAEQGAQPSHTVAQDEAETAALIQHAPRSLALRLLQAACEDAGYTARRVVEEPEDLSHAVKEPAASHSGEDGELLASRVAEQFGLKSARLFVETPGTACTLARVKSLLEELRAGLCDVLLIVGVGAGEGGGALVLRRLEDARRFGLRVYALLKSFTALARESDDDAAVVGEVGAVLNLNRGEVAEPDFAGFIEAALSGPAADADEAFRLLTRAHATRDERVPSMAFDFTGDGRGSCPAGVLGLIKTALALYDKVLPASCVALDTTPQAEGAPLYVNSSARPWIQAEGKSPRRASLYEFCQAGPTARLLLEEYDGRAATGQKLLNSKQPTELLCFSGESQAELLALVSDVKATVVANKEVPLSHLAYTLALRGRGRYRLAVLTGGADDLLGKLGTAEDKLRQQERPRWQLRNGIYYARLEANEGDARVAFMFPGYGSYYPWMLADLCLYFPPVRAWFDTLDGIFDETDGLLPSQLIFPPSAGPSAGARDAAEARLHGVRGGAQGGFTATLALHELLQNLGVRCDVMLGHSNGENAALMASGTMRFRDRRELFELLRRVTAHEDRAVSGNEIPTGIFLGVSGCGPEFIAQMLAASAGRLHLAMDNCPHQVVLFGDEAAIEAATEQIKEAGGIALRLPFDRAYHTPFYEAQADGLRWAYDSMDLGPGHTLLYSCATARPFPSESDEIRALALKQWTSRVRFRETLLELYGQGVRTFIEVGPNSTLTGFVTDTLRDREHLAVASNAQRLPGLEQLQRLLAQLYVRGADLNLEYLFRFRNVEQVAPSTAAPPRAAEQPPLTADANGAVVAQTVCAAPLGGAANGKHSVSVALPHDSHASGEAAAPAEAVQPQGATALAPVRSSTTQTDARAAILGSHFELMQMFLASQARVLAALFPGLAGGAHTGAQPSAPAVVHVAANIEAARGTWPLLGEVIERDERRLHCRRRFDLRHDTFLLDHTLGRRTPERQAQLPPLPVVPFTVSMEILAEAASCLLGGRMFVVGLRDVRGHRWLVLEHDALVLDVLAEVQTPEGGDSRDVRVQVFELGPEGQRQLSFEGVVRLARQHPPSPPPLRPPLVETLPAEVSAEDFYRNFAFHGPCFQGIRRLRAWDDQAIEVEMEVPPAETFFGAAPAPALYVPAGLLDNTGQLVGLWLLERGQRELAVFPFHAASFEQYMTPHASGTRLLCRASVRLHEHATSVADFDFIDKTNRVVARLTGLQLKNSFGRHIPKILKPQTAAASYFSDPWLQAETGLACRRVDAATLGLLEDGRGIWKRALARQALCVREREFWSGLPEKGARRAEWLAGRVAAKDAVRQWAEEKFGLSLAPEEVEICADEAGRPFARCHALGAVGAAPHISISHSRGNVVAVASDVPVGVDLESLGAGRDEGWLLGVLCEQELALVARRDTATLLALWCAKESAAKAAGTGLRADPRAWRVVGCSPRLEGVRVEHASGSYAVELWQRDGMVFALARPLGRQARAADEAGLGHEDSTVAYTG